MNFKEYTKLAIRTRKDLGNPDINDAHMLTGMMTELGELTNNFKKNLAYGTPVDLINIQEELGDILWYFVGYCDFHNFDIEEIMEKNISKLSVRYPKKYSNFKATNRDLDEERDILEGTSPLDFDSFDDEDTNLYNWDLEKDD
jgi:NTP pyrophosphatase (non-canonical NTP hydrolase)